MKFTPEGGHVSVTCGAGEQAGTVVVRVADTGIGIASDRLEKIFEPFVQVGAPLLARRGGRDWASDQSRSRARRWAAS